MRALVCEAYGPVENLKIVDLAVPEPKTQPAADQH